MIPIPYPRPEDKALIEGRQQRLQVGEQWTVEFEPEQSGVTVHLMAVAITKVSGSSYQVKIDGTTIYGEDPIPPTDTDDVGVVFVPTHTFEESLTVTVKNLSGTEATYSVQPIGWEVV